MAEYTAATAQAVASGANIAFTETAVRGSNCISHREGSGIVKLRGLTNQRRALFQVNYTGNIAIPAGGTAGPISVAIAIDGEPLTTATAIVTPTADGAFFNVCAVARICVLRGSCSAVSVENTSTVEITAQNSNLTVARIA